MSATQTGSDIRKARAAAAGSAVAKSVQHQPPTADWTVAQLTEFASTNDVDLGGATKKDDILAVLTNSSKGN